MTAPLSKQGADLAQAHPKWMILRCSKADVKTNARWWHTSRTGLRYMGLRDPARRRAGYGEVRSAGAAADAAPLTPARQPQHVALVNVASHEGGRFPPTRSILTHVSVKDVDMWQLAISAGPSGG